MNANCQWIIVRVLNGEMFYSFMLKYLRLYSKIYTFSIVERVNSLYTIVNL